MNPFLILLILGTLGGVFSTIYLVVNAIRKRPVKAGIVIMAISFILSIVGFVMFIKF